MSSTPQRFISTTDYATLKNDSPTINAILNIPNGDSISSGGFKTYTTDVTVGTVGAPMEFQISYSSGTQKWLGPVLLVVENNGLANQYQGNIFVYRVSATLVRVQATYFNGNFLAVSTLARTIAVSIRTFLPPFS